MKTGLLSSLTLLTTLVLWSCDSFSQFVRTEDTRNPALATTRLVPSQFPTIQEGIDAAKNGDTVLVSDGTYLESIRFKGKKIVVASTYLTTGDTSHIGRTIIDGSFSGSSDSTSVVYFISGEDTNSVLCGFTVQGGRGTSILGEMTGGGVLCLSGARLVRNIITGNALTLPGGRIWGAGVAAERGQMLIMEKNIVTGNTMSGTYGGGAGVEVYNMSAIIRNNIIIDNTVTTQGPGSACFAGGLMCEWGTFSVEGNLIARNSVLAPTAPQHLSYGGGVLVRDGILQFHNNRVVGNVIQTSSTTCAYGGGICLMAVGANELQETVLSGNYIASNTVIGGSIGTRLSGGGGIFTVDQRPRIENNIIVKNTAPYGGAFTAERHYITGASAINTLSGEGVIRRAGVRKAEGPSNLSSAILDAPILINNTIAHNRATASGGAIAVSGAWTPMTINTIAWGDTGTQEIYLFSGGAILVQYSNVGGGYTGTGNISAAPLFVNGDSLFNLQSSSPCIGRGIDSVQISGIWHHAPAWDYDGHPRHRPLGPQNVDMGAQEEQITVDVAARESAPESYVLEQNYPNPFNPSTVIKYQLPVAGFVRLVVYDMIGREIKVLLNEMKAPGSYDVKFDAVGLASGVYLYKLTVEDFVQTRTMLLLR